MEQCKLDVANLVSDEEIVYFYEKLVRYYSIINRNLSDTIPKIIGGNMIKKFFSGIEDALYKSISENIDDLSQIKEDPSIQKRREVCRDVSIKLQKSKDVLTRFYMGASRDRNSHDSDLDIVSDGGDDDF